MAAAAAVAVGGLRVRVGKQLVGAAGGKQNALRSLVASPPQGKPSSSATFRPAQARAAATGAAVRGSSSSSSAGAYQQQQQQQRRVFNGWTVYKGRGALAVKAIKPSWTRVDSEAGAGFSLDREGALLLEFASAAAPQKYDWAKKQTFALSTSEMAELSAASLANTGVQFYHDPNKGQSDEGAVRKTLKLDPAQGDGSFYLNLSVVDPRDNVNERIMVPLSRSDIHILRTVMDFLIPHFLGYDALVNPSLIE
eukprot:jgi/Chlat1/7878/Chrsp66S07310